jgi:hypothetical protein
VHGESETSAGENRAMDPSRIGRLTREIGLVLISSSLILCGCIADPEEEKKDDQNPANATAGHHYGGGRGVFIPMGRSFGATSGTRSGGSAPAAGSARGGFGATGHSAAAGS